ncbi:MAG TPA: methyl-accepting chemotaxis protein [Syntrophomonadaceae bacterium]|nr:methyl-accepting chemotaxis protein [Syntrophomonadaceae bacterium]
METLKVHVKDIDLLKSLFSVIITAFEDGASFSIVDREKVIFFIKHKFEELQSQVGDKIASGGPAERILKTRKVLSVNFDRDLFGGIRIFSLGGPIWADDDSDVVGAWFMGVPRLHTIAKSFDYFAPILTELFPEGGVLYATDKNKLVKKQGSSKFDISAMSAGSNNGEVSLEAMRTGREVIKELPEDIYGIPALVSCSPLLDEETSDVVGTFGLVLPRQLTNELKKMANTLQKSLIELSAAMQQIIASTSEISNNQNSLHSEIENVRTLTDQINSVMGFIKNIADETKMLGLNASIEAARAGDSGRGFGVVAEEIRKLSDESKQTVARIRDLTTQIDHSIGITTESSFSVIHSVEESAVATEEINANLQEITSLAEQLDNMAANL